jgi:hypothetical protein
MEGIFNAVSPLQSCLDSREKLLWSGQPKQGVRLQTADIFMIPFSLMWGGFAIFWEAGVLGLIHLDTGKAHPAPLFMALWGIPFVLIGLYIMVGRFFFDAVMRGKTYFGVTDRRVITLKSFFNRTVTSFDYGTMAGLNLVERSDGSGDILFGTPGPFSGFSNASWPGGGRNVTPGFYLLSDARTIYNLIREAQQRARK